MIVLLLWFSDILTWVSLAVSWKKSIKQRIDIQIVQLSKALSQAILSFLAHHHRLEQILDKRHELFLCISTWSLMLLRYPQLANPPIFIHIYLFLLKDCDQRFQKYHQTYLPSFLVFNWHSWLKHQHLH